MSVGQAVTGGHIDDVCEAMLMPLACAGTKGYDGVHGPVLWQRPILMVVGHTAT